MNPNPPALAFPSRDQAPSSTFKWSARAVFAWVLLVALTPITSTQWLAAETLLLLFSLGLFGIDPKCMWGRWKGFLMTIVFLASFVALGHPLRTKVGWMALMIGILIKNGILFGTVAALTEKLGQLAILQHLGRLGLPNELLTTISLMGRYGPLLHDQGHRMRRARQSRMVRQSLPGLWLIQSGGLSTLLVRSLERAERLNDAMVSRGWQSGSNTLQSDREKA
ncbi:MAG: energy-coupling factor transporter transmembrane component T [Planctomycetota bacterium]|nr:energy-coupling factor transporter transmembrane component T [Planctomycetota bacterium]